MSIVCIKSDTQQVNEQGFEAPALKPMFSDLSVSEAHILSTLS